MPHNHHASSRSPRAIASRATDAHSAYLPVKKRLAHRDGSSANAGAFIKKPIDSVETNTATRLNATRTSWISRAMHLIAATCTPVYNFCGVDAEGDSLKER